MNNRFHKLLPLFCALVAALAFSAFGQGIPSDLEITANSGGLAPWAENYYLHIAANGEATYARYIPNAIGEPPLEEKTFTLTSDQVAQIWQVIDNNSFFSLNAEFTDSTVIDRTFARLIIRANGVTHEVTTQNLALSNLDDIVQVINDITPPETDLLYDISVPPEIIPTDVCEQFNSGNLEFPSESWRDKLGRKNLESHDASLSALPAAAPHPGTVVACHMSLKDAIDKDLATLESKGGSFWGDGVAIEVNNPGGKCEGNLTISLYLEFWGPNATPQNVARIKNAIQQRWNGQMTSDGRMVTMQVNTRLNRRVTSPPGTPGYHQIKLVGKTISEVVGDGVNNTGSGTWETSGVQLNEIYAHEAGHLMGLPDRYDDYRKLPNGTWRRQADNKIFTSEELARILAPTGQPIDPTKRWLERPTNVRVAESQPGHANDLMATLNGQIQRSDIDALAAQAGIVVEVRPGDALVNKNGGAQNLAITRRTDIFVPTGGAIELGGLYVACIDLHKDIPSLEQRFDLGPSLESWSGIEAAPVLLTLLRFIDERDYFCEWNPVAQESIWRITDNDDIFATHIRDFLDSAGIHLGDTLLDFPRMTNSDSSDTNTTVIVPQELFVARVTPLSTLAASGQIVTLTGKFSIPSVPGVAVAGSPTWNLERPEGSAAQITNVSDSVVSFMPEVRGIYRVTMEARASVSEQDTALLAVHSTARVVLPDDRTETFEDAELEGGPFNWETEGANYWSVKNTTSHSGSYAAESGLVIAGDSTWIEVKLRLIEAGKISFAYRLSATQDDGFLKFFIDGVQQSVWTGEFDWTQARYDLAAGQHALRWVYKKDGFFPNGLERAWIDDVFFPPSAVFTAVAQREELPTEYSLMQNYPNPFNAETEIRFDLPKSHRVMLKIFDALGHEVRTLVNRQYAAGRHRVHWDGMDRWGNPAASGVYLYQMQAGAFTQVRKMALLR